MNGVSFSGWHSPSISPVAQNGDGSTKVLQVANAAIEVAGASFGEMVSGGLSSVNLSFSSLRHVFFGLRIPFIYMEYLIHDTVKDSALKLSGYVLYLFGEIGLGAQWLHRIGLIDLSRISAAIGSIGTLGSMGVSALDAGLGIISGIASVLFSIDYIYQLCTKDLSKQEKLVVGLGLASCLVHILALVIFFASGGALFAVALGLTLLSCVVYMVHWYFERYPLECLKG